ncbi:MAG: hypothetical protein IPP33_17250 [Flavobacteriales bacterium]|nr:hypothetical protein [Flavobacteriales bacterium]
MSGSGNGTYSWSGPNNFTSNAQNPVVTAAGTYVLTVTGANGCTSVAQAVVEQDNTLPGAQATGGVLNCNVSSVQLGGSGNGSFSWSGPNNYTSNVQNPTVSVAGTYVLTVTGANGCTSQASAVVESDLLAPDAFIGFFPELDCNIQSVALTGNSPQQGVSYSWSGPNGFTSADQTINVSTIGTYVLTVTGENGCSSNTQATVTRNGTLPGAQATGGVLM